jgi:hypothetical protein
MKQVILVPGTHAWDGTRQDWYSPGQPFHDFIPTVEDHELVCPDEPFVWSSRLGGVGFGSGDLVVYRAAGMNLYHYAVPPRCPDERIPPAQLVIISHSHGLQPVLFAAKHGLKIDLFIDICGPVRQDMLAVARDAKPNIRRWVHIHAGRRDRWQWYGTLFDGKWGIVRKHPSAHENLSVPEADHGEITRDPRYHALIRGVLEGRVHGE